MSPPRATLSRDPTARTETHRPDDRFIPIRPDELTAALSADAEHFGPLAACLPQLAAALTAVIDQEAITLERDLLARYAAFNPDRDTLPLASPLQRRTPEGYADLQRRLAYILNKANFEYLDDIQVAAAVRAATTHGFHVRLYPERIQHLAVWVRGRGTVERRRRTWRAPIAGRPVTLPVFRRLVVIAQLRDDPHVLVKMFKEIPIADVEALLPHADVEMNWWDRATLIGSGGGTLWTLAAKLLTAAGTALANLLWVLLLPLVILMWRTFMGYRRARLHRTSQRTSHLYFQNLSNNAAALHALIAMIADEEIKEALLLYAFSSLETQRPRGPQQLTERIEQYLAGRFGARVDFDFADAAATLERLGLWQERASLRPLPPEGAIEALKSHWWLRRTEDCHLRMIAAASGEPCSAPASGKPTRDRDRLASAEVRSTEPRP